MNQYECWWASLPPPVGKRPVLLLSRSGAYAYLTRVVVAEITTRVRGIPQEVPLGRAEGLPSSCVANLDNLRAVPKQLLVARVGRLSTRRIVEVKRAMGHAFQWPELTSL